MIPLSVRMSGWMRYRDEQVADFRGGNLISICGENGAGKSSIFDAITFALYGQHRLGKQHADRLISEDMDRLSVDFEFEAAGQRYMIRRGRTKKSGGADQSLWIWDDGGNGGAGEWTAVPNTEKEDSLDRAIAHILRLTPDAFTSSFMLQQGGATDFLDAEPKRRFEIISSLIGLREYERLEKAAKEATRVEKVRLDDMKAKLAEFDGVDETTIARLREDVAAATEREAATTAALATAQALLADAQRYTRLADDVTTLDAEIAEAATLLAGKDQIERDATLFETLDAAITSATSIQAALADASRAEAVAADAAKRAAAIDLDALASTHANSQKATQAADAAAKATETEHAAVTKAERAAHEFAQIAATILTGRGRIAEYDAALKQHASQLATLPALQAEAKSLLAIKDALPLLRVLKEAREAVEKAQKDDPETALATLTKQQSALERNAKAAEKALAAAEAALAAAQKSSAESRAHVAQLKQQRDERKTAATESTCSRCGQPVDKKKAKAEIDDLTAQLGEAQQHAAEATDAEAASDAACAAARKSQQQIAKAINDLATQIATASSRRDALVVATMSVAQRHSEFAKVAPAQLRDALNGATTAAAITKLIASHGDVPKRADATARQLDQLRGVEGQRTAALAERDRASQALTQSEATLDGKLKDIDAAAKSHAAAKTQLAQTETSLATARNASEAARQNETVARDAVASGREHRAALDAEAKERAQEATGHRQAAEAFASGLGELGDQALADPAALLQILRTNQTGLAGAPKRKLALDAAIEQHTIATAQRGAKFDEINTIPERHRVDARAATVAAADARSAAEAARAHRDATQQQLTMLKARIGQLASLQADQVRSAERYKHLRKLVRLLGKTGLQGVLVTDALATITSHSNAFLQRLTGGSLQLKLERGDGDLLEMQAIDSTCMREARSVKALSGSQKFRCAVAIASGIGQYAGAGGMRSIVIDEGFGSLDQAGQRTMVEELQQLATHMDKVIVVSHLEAFTDPANFPDRILVETNGIGSRITKLF